MGRPIPLDDIPDELMAGDPIPLDDIPDEYMVEEQPAPTAGPLLGGYLVPPPEMSESGPYQTGYSAPPALDPTSASVVPEQRVSQPRPENVPRPMSGAFDPYGGYYSQQQPAGQLDPDSFAADFNRRADELFVDPIKRGYQQTAQASNVFTGGTAVESLESAAHDIAEREKQTRAMPKADYMVEAEQKVKQIVQDVMTPEQMQRQYERRQFQDDLENGVDPKPFLPHPGYPGEAEQRQAEADLASAFGGGNVQVQQSEYNLPGDPPGMPPVIALTPGQKANAIARMTGVYLKDPRRAINVSLESLTSSGVGIGLGFGLGAAGGSVAGVPGAVVGGAVGAGSGSFLAEYGSDVLDQMRQDGIDLTNQQVVLRLLSDPAYMERVKAHALKRGATVASFDALSGALGGRVAGPVTRALEDVGKVSSKVGQQVAKIGGEGAEILTQGLAGGTGEAAGALAAGDQVDPEAVTQEFIGEAGSGGAEVLSGRYADQRAAQAYAASPEGQAAASRERALSSALDLTARIRASSPPAGTMPPPALTGSRASDAAGGTGTAPIPPAAQGTATALQKELQPGATYQAPDGEYAVVASSPNPDPNKHLLGLRGPDGSLRPWSVSEFAAHIDRANAATAQQTQLEEDAAQTAEAQRAAEAEHPATLASALAQMQPPPNSAAAKEKGGLFDALIAQVRKSQVPVEAGELAALSSKMREPKQPEPQKPEAERIASATGQMQKLDLADATNKIKSFGDLLSELGKPETERKPPPPPNPAPPAAPAPTEPASTPAPADKAVSTAQEPTAGGAASPIVEAPDTRVVVSIPAAIRALQDPAKYTQVETAQGPVRLVNVRDDVGQSVIHAFDEKGKNLGSMYYSTKPGEQPHVAIVPERQRQGIASAMYDLAEKSGGHVPAAGGEDQARTSEGKAFREGREAKQQQPAAPAESQPAPQSEGEPLTLPPPPAPRMKGAKPGKALAKELADARAEVEELWPQYQNIKSELAEKHEYLADKTEDRIRDELRYLGNAETFRHYLTGVQALAGHLAEAVERVKPTPKPLQRDATYPQASEMEPVRENVGNSDPGDVTEMPTTPDKFEEIINEYPALFEPPENPVSLPLERHWKKRGTPFISPAEAARRIESWQRHAQKQGDIEYPNGNSEKVILSLFDLTGHWAQPYADAGYDVRTLDIQNGANVLDLSTEWFADNMPDITDVYGILIACPCTDFTVSGNQHWPAKDADGRTELSKELVMQALRTVEFWKPAMWVLENPVGRIEELTGLPPARMAFDPWHFGDPYTKRTLLWGKFNTDLPTAPVDPVEGSKMHSKFGGKSQRTKNARSATPKGFASAFFMANNYLDATPAERLLSQFPQAAGAIEKALEAGFTEKQIREVVTDPYENYEYAEARDALRQLVKGAKKSKPAEPAAPAPKPAAEPKQPEPKPKEGIFTGAHPILTDRREEVITPGGTKVETSFEVVEAADLISSDNPKFPKQLQPRKRERKTSEDQIRHIVANFDPQQLGASRVASHGAPIIGMDDNYVESGNGRVMAIRKVYENRPELAKKYRQYVQLISGVDISKMKEPVLVRRRQTEMTDDERVKWTREANKDTLMQMSAAEKAAIDQEKLTPSVMSELPENMDEPLKLVAGKGLEFVERFVAQFTPAERGELIDADGKVSSIALTRARAALLQKAYGGTPAGDAAIRRAAESTDTDAQTLVNTLMHFAPAFAQLKDEIAAGRVQEQADIGPQIAEAVEVVRAAGSPGAVTRWLNTEGLLDPKDPTVKQLIQTFYTFDGRGDAKRLRSAAAIGDTLTGYLKTARQHTPAGAGGGLFGDEESAVLNPAAELGKLNTGRKEQEQQRARQENTQRAGQGGLFTAGGKPSATASTRPSDESGGEETQPTGLGEDGDTGDVEASAETDEEVDDFEDDSGVEMAMDDTDEAQADEGVENSAVEEGRHEREGERVPLPSTTRENLMRYLGVDPAEFRVMGGKQQWETAVKAIKQRFGFADIIKHKAQNWRNAVDHLLDAFESLDNLAEALKAGSRIASLGGRITLHMREKPGKTKGYFRYKPDGNEPGNTIAIYNQEDVYSHELAHGIDYDMMERAGGAGPGGLTKMIRERQNTGKLPNTLLEAMADVYNAMYYDDAAIAALIAKTQHQLSQAKTPSEKAPFQKRLAALQAGTWRGNTAYSDLYKRAMNGPMKKYLTKPTEFFARVFEAYVSHKIQGQQDMGLVKFLGATDSIYRDTADAWIKRVYPHGAERQRIFATLDNLVGQIAREDIYNVGTQSPGMQQSHVNLGLIDPVAQAKANGTPITPDIIRAHNLTNKAAMTYLEDELARNDTMLKNFMQLVDDLRDGRPGAAQRLNAAMSKFASTPDTVMQFLEMRFPNIPVLRTIRNQLSDAHIAGRNKPIGFYREWQRTEHSITNDLEDRMKAVGVVRNMQKADAEHFWDVVHGLAKPKNAAVKRQTDQFIYELARMWKLRDKTGENIGYVDEAYVNRVFLKDVADNPKFHADILRLRVQEKNDLIVALQAKRLAATTPEEIARLKAALKRAAAIDPMADTRAQVAKMKGLAWGEPVYLGAVSEDSAKERVFSAAADEILKDWYVKDPATLLQMYGSAAARGIAMRRRFGDNPIEVFQGWLDKTALELPEAYAELLKNAMEVSMGFRRDSHGSLTRMVNGAANVTTASMLGRAVFPNLSEPLNIFGKGLSVPVTFGALMKATVPFMFSASTKKRMATADRFGRLSGALVDAASSSTAMAQHIGEDTLGNGILARFSVRAYWFNAMSYLTAIQQKAMNRAGFELFYHVAEEIRKGGPGAELYRQWFREHGIGDPDAIAKFLEKSDNIDDIDLTDTLFPGTGLTLSNAITHFVHTTIQHPTPSTKHIQANRGVIGVIYRLTSWMTTNFINITRYVKNRAASAASGKYGGEEIHLRHRLSGDRAGQKLTAHERIFGRTGGTDITVGQRLGAMVAPALTVATTMYAAQAFFVIARMILTNKDEWEDRGEDFWKRFTNRKTQLQIMQYWGIMGWMMNTAVDAVEGTRYNRGVAGSLAGPAYGGWEQDAERLMMGAVSLADQVRGEKDMTVAVKNNTAQAAYHIGATIFSVGLLNTLRTRSRISNTAGFLWSVIGTSPWAQHSFADMVAGKKDKELREDSKAGDASATDELNERAADKAADPMADFLDPNQ